MLDLVHELDRLEGIVVVIIVALEAHTAIKGPLVADVVIDVAF